MSWVRGSVYDVEVLTEFTLVRVLLGCGSCVVVRTKPRICASRGGRAIPLLDRRT